MWMWGPVGCNTDVSNGEGNRQLYIHAGNCATTIPLSAFNIRLDNGLYNYMYVRMYVCMCTCVCVHVYAALVLSMNVVYIYRLIRISIYGHTVPRARACNYTIGIVISTHSNIVCCICHTSICVSHVFLHYRIMLLLPPILSTNHYTRARKVLRPSAEIDVNGTSS